MVKIPFVHSVADICDRDRFSSDSSSLTECGVTGSDSDAAEDFTEDFSVLASVVDQADSRTTQEMSLAPMRSCLRSERQSYPLSVGNAIASSVMLYPSEFKKTFRMSPPRFESLLRIVGPYIRPQLSQRVIDGRKRAGSSVLSASEKLQISLRLVAGGGYLDLMRIHNICRTVVYNVFEQF